MYCSVAEKAAEMISSGCVAVALNVSDLVSDSLDGDCEEKLCVLVTVPESVEVEVSVEVNEMESVTD